MNSKQNAIEVVRSLSEDKTILFGPDRNLGGYIAQKTGRKMVLWDGMCIVHEHITYPMIKEALDNYPDADVLIHPEARCLHAELLDHERVFFYSTVEMLHHARNSSKRRFVIATEVGTLHQLCKENPEKQFIPFSNELICHDMKKVMLQSVLDALENRTGLVLIDPVIREKALLPINRMIEIG